MSRDIFQPPQKAVVTDGITLNQGQASSVLITAMHSAAFSVI